jgi:predicted AAA+ superfamily ATPase
MKPGEISTLITGGNAWWRDPVGWAQRDVQLRAAAASSLTYSPGVLNGIVPGSLVLLRGPRRVGKSVELKRLVESLLAQGTSARGVIHVAVDGWRDADLRTLVDVGKRLVPPGVTHRWWLIDEISGVAGWSEVIKNLRDNDPEFATDTVVLTGSSAADLTRATSDLAGRRGPVSRPDRTLLPMGFRTFIDLLLSSRGLPQPGTLPIPIGQLRSHHSEQVFSALVPWLPDLVAWWEIYLQCGGFPQAVDAQLQGGDLEPLTQALFDVVHRDVFGSATLSETQTLSLLARMSENLCSPVNFASVANDLGVSPDTVTRRLDDLVSAYLMWPCHQSDALRPKVKAQSKRYFTDPLLARLAHLRNGAHPAPDLTQLTEQQLGVALTRRLEASSSGSYASHDNVLFERTPTRKEIDFVGSALEPVAIEGKYTDGGHWVGESATVNASTHWGVLATRSVLDTSATTGAASWAVPAGMLAYCIDT